MISFDPFHFMAVTEQHMTKIWNLEENSTFNVCFLSQIEDTINLK